MIKSKKKAKRVLLMWILLALVSIGSVYLIVQYVLLQDELKKVTIRLETYSPKTLTTDFGKITYADSELGIPILVAHGISGGYDQAYDALKGNEDRYRIIAPSRFGYLQSDVPTDTSPKAQAKAFAQLLDELRIEKAYVLGTSAGGTIAIRFALDFPERTLGLILYSSAMPFVQKPETVSDYQGPPAFLLNNYAMWLFKPLFKPVMGMDSDTIYQMLPISDRREGIKIDSIVVNPDMGKNYDDYPIEELQIPTLIIGARDDRVASFSAMQEGAKRFQNHEFIPFDDGGHMLVGHEDEINQILERFIIE